MSGLSSAAAASQPNAQQIRRAYHANRGRKNHPNNRAARGPSAIRAASTSIFLSNVAVDHASSLLDATVSKLREPTSSSATASGGEIIGHTSQANRDAAAALKALLEEDSDELHDEPGSISVAGSGMIMHSSAHVAPPTEATIPHNNNRPLGDTNTNADMYSQAFQRRYSADWRARSIDHGGSRDQEEVWKDQHNHILFGSHPASTRTASLSTQPSTAIRPEVKQEVASSPQPPTIVSDNHTQSPGTGREWERLHLQGLGQARSRNGYGRAFENNQELGRGVIGGDLEGDGSTTVIVTEAGCDIPMVRSAWSPNLHIQTNDDGEETKTAIGPHTISLDPDLPPLAIEHPARVWNSMIHSLSADIQPVVKWDYEKVRTDEGGDMWLAHLTLVLPPTHPTVADHPLFRTLPKNRFKREYVSAVEALGGIKKWTGDPRRLKPDATNTTLVKCIADNALAWIHAPDGLAVIPDSDDEEEDQPYQTSSQGGRPSAPSERVLSNASDSIRQQSFNQDMEAISLSDSERCQQVISSDQIQIDEDDLDIPAEAAETTSTATTTGTAELATPQTAVQEFLTILERTLGQGALDLQDSVSFSTVWEPIRNRYGCTLVVGIPGALNTYQEDCVHYTSGEAQEAVCKKALELKVDDFMGWIKETLTPLQPVLDTPTSQEDIIVRLPSHGAHVEQPTGVTHQPTAKEADERNWPNELTMFCHFPGRASPQYLEQLFPHEGRYTLVSQLIVGPDNFSIPKEGRTTEEAREYLARRVLVDHYGQTPGQLYLQV